MASSLGDFPGEVPYDSDPYDVVAYRGGWVVADAGANDLLYVSATGRVSLLARFPAVAEQLPAGVIGNPAPITIEAQPVPTSVAIGPDGALYVGLLRGVVRVSDNGRTVTTLPVSGLYQPTGVAVSANGTVDISNDGDSNTVSSSQSGEIVKITGLS
jgi:DNA-binding beta-propeller fold protein YncE